MTNWDNIINEHGFVDIGSTMTPQWIHDGRTQDRRVREIFGTWTFVVGGAVRDELAGIKPKDRDYLVLFKDVKEIGDIARHAGYSVTAVKVAGRKVGVRIAGPGLPKEGVEVCPPRREVSTGPGHKDFDIEAIPADEQEDMGSQEVLNTDLGRRDWTVNAMARWITNSRLIDPFRAEIDMHDRRLVPVNDKVLVEDPLRILRGMYLLARLGLRPDESTIALIARSSAQLAYISKERIGGELNKIVVEAGVVEAFLFMRDIGLWPYICPRIAQMVGFDQRSKYHNEELFEHCLTVLYYVVLADAGLREDSVVKIRRRWAAFLHDIGKLETQEEKGDGTCRYHGHDAEGCRIIVQEVGPELRWPRKFTQDVATIVLHHMIEPSKKASAGRRFRAQVGQDDLVQEIYRVRLADMLAHPTMTEEEHIGPLYEQWNKTVLAFNEPCFQNELAVNGIDIMKIWVTDEGKADKARNDAEGRLVGETLKRLTRDVIGDPTLNNRDWLLRQASKYRKELTK